MFVRETAREIPVLDQIDVLVAGGGVSGSVAAISAARTGAKTCLVERNGVLGGVATAGLMANIGNLFLDGRGRQVIRGIPAEVVQRMVDRGAASADWACREVPGIVIDSEQLKVLLGEMAVESGVTVLTHTWAARPIMEDSTVLGAFVEGKTGRQAILARVLVDATGEADLAAQTGCSMRWSDGSASLEFKMANVDLDALYRHFARHPETFPVGRDMVKGFAEFERNWVERGIFFFPHGGGKAWDIVQRAIKEGRFQAKNDILYDLDAVGLYGLRGQDTCIVNSNFWRVTTLDPIQVSRAELASQRVCNDVAAFMRENVPGFDHSYIVEIANDLGIRVSRGIEGRATLTGSDASSREPVHRDDVIGCVPCRCSFESSGRFFRDHTFDIPMGVMLPKGTQGLLVASGKSVSAVPQGLVRGMSNCMLLGQAAGVAASVAARQGTSVSSVDIREVQRELLSQGAFLGTSDRLRHLGLR